MKKETVVLHCNICGEMNIISPPKRKLRKTVSIELSCLNCKSINHFNFVYKLKK